MPFLDPQPLAEALIRCQSVTPADGGALDLLSAALETLGFQCERHVFSAPGTPDVDNLYARLGTIGRNFCFAGHTDVVPIGDAAGWSADPFAATVRDGMLFGRGAIDMKGAIAAFVTATARLLDRGAPIDGSISLLITGDEEGPSINGTRKLLEVLADRGERLDACLVGEPTSSAELGDTIKIGRRGSLNAVLTVEGVAGHTAYPHLADNPVHRLVAMLRDLTEAPVDEPTEAFQASTLQVSTIDVGNPATNVIPARAIAKFNVRFNDRWTGAAMERWLRERLAEHGDRWALDVAVSGESFVTPPSAIAAIVADAAEAVTGVRPEYSTSGGTSDARFIHHYCPVAELGLVNQTMHKIDERVDLQDLETLTQIYLGVLERFFATS